MNNKTNIEEDIEILEDNYQMLSEDVSSIAKELNLEEDAMIDEIYTAIRILKAKANKYNSLVEKIEDEKEEIDEELEQMKVDNMYGRYKQYGRKAKWERLFAEKYGIHDILQELLDEVER